MYDAADECFIAQVASASVITKDGKPFSLARSDVSLIFTFRAPNGEVAESAFEAGAAQVDNADVDAAVDGRSYPFFAGSGADNAGAWAKTVEDDAHFLAAAKGGKVVTISTVFPDNVKSHDTFTLQGFNEALDNAALRCGKADPSIRPARP
ncbi:hypothetical protein [Pararhizobium sp.]|uniref:hypothetical protein n=1 Tax=Pararhizobium sp. TaxID=1977563 RepID=UPI00271DB46C|nr:hypothetical protein [Pararhizobium sp.]MDO9415077.1 hypothetical protein [Pararhizobium sp.]